MPLENIKPGGYVRSGLARMSISFYNELSGIVDFSRNHPENVFPLFLLE